MRVVTPEDMARVDRAAMEAEKIPGLTLMERAGEAVARAAIDMARAPARRVAVWCGKGNNGGDGFVAARLLSSSGLKVTVYMLADPDELRGDALENFRRLEGLRVDVVNLGNAARVQEAAAGRTGFDVAIDAVFGTGFKGKSEGVYREALEAINSSGCPVLAVDIPSGVSGLTGAVEGTAVKAGRTVTFQAPKVGLLQYPGAAYAGELEIIDIGIPAHLLETVPETRIYTFDDADAAAVFPERAPDAHKRECGSVLVVGGSPGLTGAAALCSRAALRSGAGLVTLALPNSLNDIMEVKLTEVMTRPLSQTRERTLSRKGAREVKEMSAGYDALALGPGLSTNSETVDAVRELVRGLELPIVLDADGLNAFEGKGDLLRERSAPLVVTPHPGEMGRLEGVGSGSIQSDRLGNARKAASRWNAVVVLKGAGTVIAEPEGVVRIGTTGNPGMATAGMGDVLTGCVAAFLAQGISPFDAASLGVHFHGLAADLSACVDGMVGMTSGDVIRYLPHAMRRVSDSER